MPCRLGKEEVVTLRVLSKKGMKKTEIAEILGVSEGAVRYWLRRISVGARDGRANKRRKASSLAVPIDAWHEEHKGRKRPMNVLDLYEHLLEQYGYEGSYKSVLRYVRDAYGKPKMRTYRRVETPAGAQSQTDWAEFPAVNIGNGPEPLSAFVMALSHSRMPAVIWRRGKDQLSWLESHNEAFRWLGGVSAVNRIDNVKTAIARGAGAWGEINPVYRAYARTVGFHIDACESGQANAKGKVEAKVRLSRLQVNPRDRPFDGLEHLQSWSNRRILRWAQKALCPATGLTVLASWEAELRWLRVPDALPQPFDVVVVRPVGRDCLVNFESRSYAVPFGYAGEPVEVRGCAETVEIWAEGKRLLGYPRHSAERILIDPRCYEGEATDRVLPPPPLGRMGRKLQQIMEMPVDRRPIDLYAALAEVAR